MVKKAVILAAGQGKRMEELTKFLPKPLLPINNRPFLFYTLKTLKEFGFQEIGIVVHYKKEKIRKFLKKHKLKAVLIEQKKLLGTGHALKAVKNFAREDNFLVLMGDDYYSKENIKLISQKDDRYSYLLGYKHKNPERFGVLIEKNGFLKRIVEKPKKFISNLVNIGLYKLSPEIFKALEKTNLSKRGEYELTDALSLLAKFKKVKVLKVNKGWLSMNTPEEAEIMDLFFTKNFH